MDLNDLNPNQQKKVQEMVDANAFKQKVLQHILESENIQKYLNQFSDSSRESFVQSYCNLKCSWYEYGPIWEKHNESDDLRWLNLAKDQIEAILQKKLFDAQCKWRAELITLPGVEICYDFHTISADIFNCSFIEPITKDEIDLYVNFLNNNEYALNEDAIYLLWQDYNQIKQSYNGEDAFGEIPEWYEYHNNHTGNTILLQLPDIRGEKEGFYLRAARDEHSKHHSQTEHVKLKPSISTYDEEQVAEFVNLFEDKETKRWYKAYSARFGGGSICIDDPVEEYVDELVSINEPIPVESHYDLKEAIQIAMKNFRRKKVAETLPIAYEQYLMNLELGIGYDKKEDEFSFRNFFAQEILKGRVLKGEPEDFNF